MGEKAHPGVGREALRAGEDLEAHDVLAQGDHPGCGCLAVDVLHHGEVAEADAPGSHAADVAHDVENLSVLDELVEHGPHLLIR